MFRLHPGSEDALAAEQVDQHARLALKRDAPIHAQMAELMIRRNAVRQLEKVQKRRLNHNGLPKSVTATCRRLSEIKPADALIPVKGRFDPGQCTETGPGRDLLQREEAIMTKAARPTIELKTVCRVIVKARQFDAKEGIVEEDYGANAIDDDFREVLADTRDDPVYHELRSFIRGLDEDDQCELVALTWLGRGDFERQEWPQALAMARQEHNDRTAEYLLGTPLLPDYLAEGLAKFGWSCSEFEGEHLP